MVEVVNMLYWNDILLVHFSLGFWNSVACCLFFTNPLPFFPCNVQLVQTFLLHEMAVTEQTSFNSCCTYHVTCLFLFCFCFKGWCDRHISLTVTSVPWNMIVKLLWKKKKAEKRKQSVCHQSRFTVKQGVDWFFPWLLLCGRLVILLFLVRATDNKSQSAK